MFGGGAMLGSRPESVLLEYVGIVDDAGSEFEIQAYLGGALERYFTGWGKESTPVDEPDAGNGTWGQGRTKAMWTGIMGLSADGFPWVGRVPMKVSGRTEPVVGASSSKVRELGNDANGQSLHSRISLTSPGEWISAGYTGEGMTQAWLSGEVLARMILGVNDGKPEMGSRIDFGPHVVDLPKEFGITDKRWKAAKIEDFFQGVVS